MFSHQESAMPLAEMQGKLDRNVSQAEKDFGSHTQASHSVSAIAQLHTDDPALLKFEGPREPIRSLLVPAIAKSTGSEEVVEKQYLEKDQTSGSTQAYGTEHARFQCHACGTQQITTLAMGDDRGAQTSPGDAPSVINHREVRLLDNTEDHMQFRSFQVRSECDKEAEPFTRTNQSSAQAAITQSGTWKVIHRVRPHVLGRNDTGRDRENNAQSVLLYLDQPQKVYNGNVYDDSEVEMSLHGDMPINLNSYLSRHPEIVFVVFKNYDIETTSWDVHKALEQNNEQRSTEEASHTGESLMVVSRTIWNDIRVMFQRLGSIGSHSSRIKLDRELEAPYLYTFHYADALNGFARKLATTSLNTWNLMLSYIHESRVEQVERDGEGDDYAASDARSDDFGDLRHEMGGHNMEEIPFRYPQNRTEIILSTHSWAYDGLFKEVKRDLVLSLSVPLDRKVATRSLGIFPIQYVEPSVVERLRHRGLEFWRSKARRYVSYKVRWDSEEVHNTVDRYMIDVATYKKLHPGALNVPGRCYLSSSAMQSRVPPRDPFLFLLPDKLPGFNMRSKQWEDVVVELFTDIVWNKLSYDRLVLEKDKKNLIKALIMRQIDVHKATDLVGGKGNGLILLLHGKPGVGKTYTAESVAEVAEKPLYRVTSSDLGTQSEDVDKNMSSVLKLGKKWDCIVLLDEADIYLDARRSGDLERNTLVAVFQRQLEYYDGILILTSNRVGTFDDAFQSRIQLAVHYPQLLQSQREEIWSNFFLHLQELQDGQQTIDFDDILSNMTNLGQYILNGTQIRNAITTARQLSLYEETVMRFADLKKAIELAQEFGSYIGRIRRRDSERQRARIRRNRAGSS